MVYDYLKFRLMAIYSGARMLNIARSLEDLKDALIDLNNQMNVIQESAKNEDRELSEDELGQLKALLDTFDGLEEELKLRQSIKDKTDLLTKPSGRKTEPNQLNDGIARPDDSSPQPARRPRGHDIQIMTPANFIRTHGFDNLGEFAVSVRAASRGSGMLDPRLVRNAPTTYSTEGIGADGGFAVPPDFRAAIMEKVLSEDSLLARTDRLESSSNTIILPKDETTPWQSTGGVQAYWEGEADQLAQSKVSLQQETLRLNKLAALVPVTEELLEDAPSLDSYLRRKVPEKFDFKINLAMVQGTGAGQPTGIINANCLVSVTKESGQAADTIQFENIVNMWSRMYGPCRSRSVWLINQDIEPQLFTMSFEGTSSSVPAYLPANGLSASPYGTLMGRPVIPTQACETLGDKGDIILADFSQYLTALKTGGVRAETSIHLWFDYDMTAYRFIMRVAGQPWWTSYITPRDSSNYLSPFVTLDERA